MSKAAVTIDFDHHSTYYRDNWDRLADERVRNYPMAWTEAHGGFWVVSNYAAVSEIVWSPERFSSSHNDPAKPWAKGILIPELPYTLALSESDPPVHTKRRAVEAPFFSPRTMRASIGMIENNIEAAMAEFIDKGEVDIAPDFAMRVPAQNTISLVGIDPSLWKVFMLSAHQASLLPATHPDYPLKEIKFVQSLLREELLARVGNSRGDILSALANAQIGGAPIDIEIQVGMISAAIFGGFGTVMATFLRIVMWLEKNRDVFDRLLEDDALVERLINEILRVYPPSHSGSRTVAEDCEFLGQQLRKGERIMASFAAANRDPAVFENPTEVRLDRANAHEHFSFSGGAHRCLGAPLARLELRYMIRALLRRMPDFEIDHAGIQLYPSFANNAGIVNMPIRFTPGGA